MTTGKTKGNAINATDKASRSSEPCVKALESRKAGRTRTDGKVTHTLEPVYDQNSRILILGTMPSPKSREYGFYYSHPQNRFWPVMGELFSIAPPATREERIHFLHNHYIALWDVLHSCKIAGADDASIREPVANDFSPVFEVADIRVVFTTGATATKLFNRLCSEKTGREAVYLPSTSPANCRHYSFSDLVEAYRPILAYLK